MRDTNRPMRFVTALAGCAALIGWASLVGCADADRSAGGSSYETENALTARIIDADGMPASGVRVRVRPLAWIAGEPVDSSLDVRSDATGRISLELPVGAWRLEARSPGVAALLDVPDGKRPTDMGVVRLSRPASITGRTTPGARVGASGLEHSAVADAGGVFHLDSLPAGVHVLRQVGSAARAFVQAEAGQSRDAGFLRVDSVGQIYLDDFEDGDTRLLHGAWTGGGWWWVNADSGVNLAPDSVSRLPGRAVFADGGGGKVFHFSAAFPAGASSTSWAQCGLDFGPRPLDLSGLVSIRFRARGIGVAAILVNIDGATPAQIPQTSVVLDSVWTDFEVPVSALQLPSWSGVILDSASRAQRLRQAVGLTWSLSASGDLWLDDIRLVGPSPALLWGATPPP